MPRQTLTFLTPCFCGGADPRNRPAELRVPSVRGHLRFWTRVLTHVPAKPDISALAEHNLFGGTRAKALGFRDPHDAQQRLEAVSSRFLVRLQVRQVSESQQSLPMCPHDPNKGRRQGFDSGTEFDLEWGTASSAGTGCETEFRRSLKAWVLLGSLGVRANRAAGSVWRSGWRPSERDYLREVKSLWPTLAIPAYLSVKVLRRPTEAEIRSWNPPVRTSEKIWHNLIQDHAEVLRAIATDVLEFGTTYGGAFGHGGAAGRKGSPIKLKVGLFDDGGYRLIAVVDRRDGRDGSLKAAITELVSNGKPLGFLLKDAKL